ncbi:MAG TPA: NAD-dependent epimerase/dehydratase family protein [Vicinamibacterales bacterium]|nr:NAD-dependent epimerase/dehydratase family protein [Vicinamibacterales bacterium]
MQVFLTGATGYIGSAVLDALLRAGHHVRALVRDPEKAAAVVRRRAEAILGDLQKPSSYAAAAAECEAIVHTAFERAKRGPRVDRLAIETLLAAARRRAAAGGPAAVIYTSEVWVLGATQGRATEEAPVNPTPLVAWRPEHERLVLEANRDNVRTAVVRPGIVYGGAHGIIGDMLKDADNGLLRVVGDGTNHWPCIYHRDLADLYVRLVGSPDAAGVFHANDEADERVIDIVEAIAAHARRRPDVRHVPLQEARVKMGSYADALALDQIVGSPRARAIGWAPALHSVARNVARIVEEFRATREAA